ncbi:anti-sigma factor antagonist [Streptomyces yaanensis]|uniref:Anti-sigma factor antagonist n=1 Tax=Streptomyces yaanensis TaxID=1142239 RepID=A0ABV7SLN0_9ACTN|nr:anti-sigma factor antagonist [Streptomyces sp. CGMCC 4.7035]WNC00282.1 anti-sigma factor antagonist [Streptomyces sp. CGMCC 4.7035]
METQPNGDRTAVVVSGELDIDTEQALQDALRDALRHSVGGIDVDLAGVDFCDCSGLNVLLCVRRRALEDAKTLALSATGPAVEKLLSLTGTRALFGLTGSAARTVVNGHAARPRAGPSSPGEGERPEGTDEDLQIELVQLRRAMQTRPVIDLARGVLMASFALSAQDAWRVLVTVSQNTNTKLHHVAQDLVMAVNGDTPPGPLQRELATAVTALKEPASAPPHTAR